jgi:hypothetical protein
LGCGLESLGRGLATPAIKLLHAPQFLVLRILAFELFDLPL